MYYAHNSLANLVFFTLTCRCLENKKVKRKLHDDSKIKKYNTSKRWPELTIVTESTQDERVKRVCLGYLKKEYEEL